MLIGIVLKVNPILFVDVDCEFSYYKRKYEIMTFEMHQGRAYFDAGLVFCGRSILFLDVKIGTSCGQRHPLSAS